MANMKLFLLSIFLIFAIMVSSITTEEAAAATEAKSEVHSEAKGEAMEGEHAHEGEPEHEGEHDHEHEGEHEHEGAEGELPEGEHSQGEGEEGGENAQGNILDEAGKEDLKELGFDTKEVLTAEEMRTLYKKVLLKAEISDPQEREFYEKLIENVMKEVPAEVKQAAVRDFFEIPFLMKYVDQSGMKGEEGEAMPEMPEGTEAMPEATKEDM